MMVLKIIGFICVFGMVPLAGAVGYLCDKSKLLQSKINKLSNLMIGDDIYA